MITNEELFDIMQVIPGSKAAIVLVLRENGEFFSKCFGESIFLEKIGMLDTCKHDLQQDASDEFHIKNYHNKGE
jgi:hypothetical protein